MDFDPTFAGASSSNEPYRWLKGTWMVSSGIWTV
jgi:hypothetical protein